MKKQTKTIILGGGIIFVLLGIFLSTPALAQQDSLTGTITEPDGITGVSAYVYVHNGSWTYYNSTYSGSDGKFTFYDLPADNYTVTVMANHLTYGDPDPITTYVAGSPVKDLGVIKLLSGAAVTLTLTKSDGVTPITNYNVNLHDNSYSLYKSATTNASGVASFSLSTPGEYTIEFYNSYDGESAPASLKFTYSGVTVVLSAKFKGNNVTGYIKYPDGSACTNTACSVSIYDNNWQHYFWTSPDSTGKFSLNVSPSGNYTVNIYYSGGGLYSAPDPFTVSIDDTVTNDLGTKYLASPNITGKLLTPNGEGVPNVGFNLHNKNWSVDKPGSTGQNGSFGIAITTTGDYLLEFWLNSGSYPDYAAPSAIAVNYTGSAIDLGNIYLSAPIMKGKVVNDSNQAVNGASVSVHDRTFSYDKSWWGSTDVDGQFTVNRNLPSGTYIVDITPSWNSEGLLSVNGISVTLTSGQTNTDYLTNPIALGTAKKVITGKVTYSNGVPISNAQIETWSMGGKGGGFAMDQTDASGNYSLGVGKGSYNVNVRPMWGNWQDNQNAPDWGSPGSEFVEFTQGDTIAETKTVNFEALKFDSTLTGKIVRPNGDPLGDIMSSVDAWPKGSQMGNYTPVQPDGTFSMKLAGGVTYEIMVWAFNTQGEGKDSDFAGPTLEPITMKSGQTTDLGTVKLVEKNSHITGKVTDTNGVPISGVNIDAWSKKGGAWGMSQTDSSGDFDVKVVGGNYMVHAFSGYAGSTNEEGANYVPITAPQEVTIASNATVSNVNFQLGIVDATIKGHLETASGELVDTWGWVNASNSRDQFEIGDMWYGGFLGGPLEGGQFEVQVPAGKYSLKVFMDWNAEYIQDSDVTCEIASGETKDDVVISVIETNAVIQGRFKDSDGNTVSNLWGQIFANRAEGGSAFNPINPDGSYSLKVAKGTWRLNYFIDPFSGAGYLPSSLEEKEVTIGENETVNLDFTVFETDSEISGTVEDNNGVPIEGAHVYASLDYAGQKRDDAYQIYGFNSQEATSDAQGKFSLMMPEGQYYLHASLPPELGYIFGGAQLIYSSPASPAKDLKVVFNVADAQINGTVTLDSVNSDAMIYAYTDNGGYAEATTNDGVYTVPVTSDETWHVGAIDEDGNSYYLSGQEDIVVDQAQETQDLALEYQGEMPDSVSVTFDPSQAYNLELEDGLAIEAPARAFSSSSESVTLSVDPTAQMAYQASSQPLGGYGYEMTARDSDGSTITTFNSNVNVNLPYNEDLLTDLNLEEDDLDGKYYSPTSGIWEEPDTEIQDQDDNSLAVPVDHFSVFSAVTPGVSQQSSVPEEQLTLTVTSPEDGAIVTSDTILVAGVVSDPAATVTILLNGVSNGDVAVSYNGGFSQNVSGLIDGENTILVNAIKGLISSDSVSRTVTYAQTELGETPLDTATGISYDIVTVTNENSAPHIRVFSQEGKLLHQFFAFSETFRGEFRILTADVNKDGEMEIVAWPYGEGYSPQVRIFTKDGTLLAQTFVLNEGYRSGIEVINNADFDADGRQDLVIVPRGNGGVNLRVYKYNSQAGTIDLLAWTMAYDESYKGEVSVVTANVTGDEHPNIIVSPLSGGPNVRIYHYDANKGALELDDWFMAYQEDYRDGVLVTTGDVNGDKVQDIITYPKENAGANVRVYSYSAVKSRFELLDWIQPYSATYRGSLTVKVADLDKDGDVEIITVPATGGGPNLRVYSYNSTTEQLDLTDWGMVFAEDFRGGVDVAVSNLDGDEFREVVVYPLENGGPNLRVYEYDAAEKLNLLDWTLAYAEDFRGKMSVKVADLDGDGDSALIVSPLNGGGPNVRIYEVADGELSVSNWFLAYAATFRGGVITKLIY